MNNGWKIYDLKDVTYVSGINAMDEWSHIRREYLSEIEKHKKVYKTDFDETLLQTGKEPFVYNRIELKDRPENFEYELNWIPKELIFI